MNVLVLLGCSPELERKLDHEWSRFGDRWNTRRPYRAAGAEIHASRLTVAILRGCCRKRSLADILSGLCQKVGVNRVVGVNLFDVYCRGKGVAEGYKSLAISLILQDTNRTHSAKKRRLPLHQIAKWRGVGIPRHHREGLNLWRPQKLKCQNICLMALGL